MNVETAIGVVSPRWQTYGLTRVFAAIRLGCVGFTILASPMAAAEILLLSATDAEQRALSQANFKSVEAADRDAARATRQRLPRFENPSLILDSESVTDNGSDSEERTILLRQPLDLSGTRKLRRLSDVALADEIEAGAQHQQVNRRLEVRSLYFKLRHQQSRNDLLRESDERIRDLLRTVQVQVSQGQASRYEWLQLKHAHQAIILQLATSVPAEIRSRTRLSNLLELAAGVDVRLEDPLMPPKLPELSVLRRGLAALPHFRRLGLRSRAIEMSARAERRSVWSEMAVTLGHKRVNQGPEHEDVALVGFEIPLPIFDRRQKAGAMAQIQAEKLKAQAHLELRDRDADLVGQWKAYQHLYAQAHEQSEKARHDAAALIESAAAAYEGAEASTHELAEAFETAATTLLGALDLVYDTREAHTRLYPYLLPVKDSHE